MRGLLFRFLRNPAINLPPDPGSGGERVSLSLPREEFARLILLTRDSDSVSLRRLLAWGSGFQSAPALAKQKPKVPSLEEVLAPYRAVIRELEGKRNALAASQTQRNGIDGVPGSPVHVVNGHNYRVGAMEPSDPFAASGDRRR